MEAGSIDLHFEYQAFFVNSSVVNVGQINKSALNFYDRDYMTIYPCYSLWVRFHQICFKCRHFLEGKELTNMINIFIH